MKTIKITLPDEVNLGEFVSLHYCTVSRPSSQKKSARGNDRIVCIVMTDTVQNQVLGLWSVFTVSDLSTDAFT